MYTIKQDVSSLKPQSNDVTTKSSDSSATSYAQVVALPPLSTSPLTLSSVAPAVAVRKQASNTIKKKCWRCKFYW
jgi:hypothetical protein